MARYATPLARYAVPFRPAMGRTATERSTGLLPALRTLSQTIDLSRGTPRIVILSPFDVSPESLTDVKTAREAGFASGSAAGLDFRRAEIVGIGFSGAAGQHLQAYAEAFFLRSKGMVVGWRSDGLPQLPSPPNAVRVFGGVADYGDISAPVQIRIATDFRGNLVNSWIEVTAGRSLASPISGKAICRSKDACEVKGDGRLLGQAWNPEPQGTSRLRRAVCLVGNAVFRTQLPGPRRQSEDFRPSAGVRNQSADRRRWHETGRNARTFDVRRTDEQQF